MPSTPVEIILPSGLTAATFLLTNILGAEL